MDWILHSGHDGGEGVEAWTGALLGFSTWAESEVAVLDKLAARLDRHYRWADTHGIELAPMVEPHRVVERLHMHEGLLPIDRGPAGVAEIDTALALLTASRRSLLETLDLGLSRHGETLLDWDPPYENFAPWADWRTIRENLAHIANGEVHYYCRLIGHLTEQPVHRAPADWPRVLSETRSETLRFLKALRHAPDLERENSTDTGYGTEHWTVRKSLRRLVSHELLHWHSIQRIVKIYPGDKQR